MSVYKRGERYWIEVFYGKGENMRRYRASCGTNHKATCQAEAAIKAKIAAGDFTFLNPRPTGTALADLIDRYLETWSRTRKTPVTYRRDRDTLELFKSHIGNRPITSISQRDIEAYVTRRMDEPSRRGGTIKADTVNREMHVIKHVFTKAVEWGELETSVAHKVKNLKSPPGRLRYLTLEEARSLLNECRKSESRNLHDIVLTALHTGARRGELFSLKWEQVDFTNRAVKIVGTKNNTIRVVPMTNEVREALSKRPHHIKSEFVFFGPDGSEMQRIHTSFSSAVDRTELHDFRFHDLRHTYASWLVQNGTDILTVKELLGHKRIEMTMRYSHLSPWNLRRTADTLNAFWRGESGQLAVPISAKVG